jgi:SAM-dependent methyltransferase
MELSEYRNIFEHEETHFFYQTNHQIIIALLKKYATKSSKLKILDAGCGTGLLLQKLSVFGQAQGVDISPEALKFCRLRHVKAQRASLTKLPFKDKTFDVVVSVDVLYHLQISSDLKALQELRRVLKPGGILIMRLPANKWLKLVHDRHVHTRQRYTTDEVRQKLTTAGFKVRKVSYVNSLFLLMALLKFGMEKLSTTEETNSGVATMPEILNTGLVKISALELWWLKRSVLPFGLGVIAVGQK